MEFNVGNGARKWEGIDEKHANGPPPITWALPHDFVS